MVCGILVGEIVRKLGTSIHIVLRRTSSAGTSLPSHLSRWLLILGSLCGRLHGGKVRRFLSYHTANYPLCSTRFRREANKADNKAATVAVDSLINFEAVKVHPTCSFVDC